MIRNKKKPNTSKQINELLHPIVKEWFFSRFKEYSLPQLYGVMEVHSRNNILVSAPTGATKTLTSFLAILNELVDSSKKGILEDKVYAVYVSPLKALNNDIQKNLIEPLQEMEKINGESLGLRIAVRTGDTTQKEKTNMLKNPPHILITTPESLAIMLSSIKFSNHLKHVEWAIVDEIHSIAENKRGVHLSLSLERLQRLSPGMCRIGLSATVAPLEEIANYLVGEGRSCKMINVQYIKEMDLQVLSPVDDLVYNDFETIQKETYKLIDKLVQEHKTTLIFTNTRAGTERVVHHLKTRFPQKYYEVSDKSDENESLIGAHHGSLSKEHRVKLEDDLRLGKMRAVVCSTSLELGIDIGYIDLVICLGSPKSVARFLQRAGRAGHKLHETVKARILVMGRDDLVECSVILKNAVEKKIDRIHIPTNSLDVLAQQIFGMALEEVWDINKMYKVIRSSYCYKDLKMDDFHEILDYLAGNFISLEDRYIYARIWWDKEYNKVGKKGRMSRVIYMTNIGTIPDQHGISVKDKTGRKYGTLDESFLEKLDRGDVFVLGGNTYQFLFARGMVATVMPAPNKKPTVPSWSSERLPLSYDLAKEIQHFRFLMHDKLRVRKSKKEVLKFIHKYLYVDEVAAEALYNYFKDQHDYIGIPHEKNLIVEHYRDESMNNYTVFHTLYGRRVNDALSRSLAFAIARSQHKDVEIGISDNGFYVSFKKPINVMKALSLIKLKEFRKVLELAIDKSVVLRRRFRHCAGRAMMILRNYGGKRKPVGRQQVSSMILLSAVRRISDKFFILRETRREILEDLMDINSAMEVFSQIESKKIKIKEIQTFIPSPFALDLVMQGYSDILRIEDKQKFLQRMHTMVKAKIALKKGR